MSKKLENLKAFNFPLMVGCSRSSLTLADYDYVLDFARDEQRTEHPTANLMAHSQAQHILCIHVGW
jgi:hypothetical protein